MEENETQNKTNEMINALQDADLRLESISNKINKHKNNLLHKNKKITEYIHKTQKIINSAKNRSGSSQ